MKKLSALLLIIAACNTACQKLNPKDSESFGYDYSPLKQTEINQALTGEVSFKKHIMPVLNAKCVFCHDADAASGAFVMTLPDSFFQAGKRGIRVVPGHPEKSVLVTNIHKAHGKVRAMPPVGTRLLDPEKTIIERWVKQGAKVKS